MSKEQSNPLIESGKPLFFKVANADVIGFEIPEIRLERRSGCLCGHSP